MFPNEFCDSYIHNIDDWWTLKNTLTNSIQFMKLQLKEPKEDMILLFFQVKN